MIDWILKKIDELAYDLYAIWLPGVILILSSMVLILINLIIFFNYKLKFSYLVMEEGKYLIPSSKNDLVLNVIKMIKPFMSDTVKIGIVVVFLFLLMLVCYLGGIFLKTISKNGIFKTMPLVNLCDYNNFFSSLLDSFILKILCLNSSSEELDNLKSFYNSFFLKKNLSNPRSYNPNKKKLLLEIAKLDEFSKDSTTLEKDKEIEDFFKSNYVKMRNFVTEKNTKTLLNTFQNKYTFHRSLSTCFSFLFWFQIFLLFVLIVVYYKEGLFFNSFYLFVIFANVTFLFVMAKSFYLAFCYDWEVWGDHLISDAHNIYLSKGG